MNAVIGVGGVTASAAATALSQVSVTVSGTCEPFASACQDCEVFGSHTTLVVVPAEAQGGVALGAGLAPHAATIAATASPASTVLAQIAFIAVPHERVLSGTSIRLGPSPSRTFRSRRVFRDLRRPTTCYHVIPKTM
jgi:hypothetical protein